MTERSITARLRAEISDYRSKMGQAAQSTRQVGDAADQTSKRAGISFSTMAKTVGQHEQSISKLSTTALGLGTAVGAGVGVAIGSFATFDKQMSAVEATGEATGAVLQDLRDTAVEAGADTAFSATEAAGGIENLLKAGVEAEDVIGGGLAGALDLAAAGGLGVADAAEIAATALTQFKLEGRDVPHVADLLAAGAGKAQGDVSDLAQALNQSGLVASQFGLDIEDTVGSLAAFASNGLLGSDAGTSFKTMLLALANPSKESRQLMDDLGISAYDAQGEFVGVSSLAEQLKTKLGDLTDAQRDQALAQIFGNDAVRAANVLYEQGAAGIDEWRSKVDDSGYAAETAQKRLDNLSGDVEALGGTLESVFINSGGTGNDVLRQLVQGATELLKAVNGLPPELLEAGLGIGAVSAASLLAVGGVGKLAGGLLDTYEALDAIAPAGSRARGVVADLGKSAALAVGFAIALRAAGAGVNAVLGDTVPSAADGGQALVAYAGHTDEAAAAMDRFIAVSTTGDLSIGASDINTVGEAVDRLLNKSGGQKVNDWATGLVSGLSGVRGTAELLEERFAALDESLTRLSSTGAGDEAAASFKKIRLEAAENGVAVDELLTLFPEYHAMLQEQATQLGVTELSAQGYADWMGGEVPEAIRAAAAAADTGTTSVTGLDEAALEAAPSFEELAAKITDTGNAILALSGSQIGVEAAIDDLSQSLKDNGKTLDLNSEKGRTNQQALDSLAGAAIQLRDDMVAQGKSSDEVAEAMERARKKWIEGATAAGMSKKEARELAKALFAVPKDTKADVSAPGATTAKTQADALDTALRNIPKSKRTEVLSAFKKGGVDAAYAALRAIDGKTATTYINTVRSEIYRTADARRAGRNGGDNSSSGRAYGGPIDGDSPHIRADNIHVMATAGEFMQDVPAVNYWGQDTMYALLGRRGSRDGVRAALGLEARAYGGLIGGPIHPVQPATTTTRTTAADLRPVEQRNYITQPADPRLIANLLGRELQSAMAGG